MTREQKVRLLSKMIDSDTEEEDILGLYLDLAGDKILNRMYPYTEDYEGLEVPARYDMIQLNIATYLLNKRGAEGQLIHSENGISRTYGSADIPPAMLSVVTPFCEVM